MCFSVQIDRDVNKVAQRLGAQIDKVKFDFFTKKMAEGPKKFKGATEDGRIYPNYYAPVVVMENEKRIIRPMRYRIRPAGSKEEVPSKFNLYNARLDSLLSRRTWETIVGKKHCIIPVISFYEWVSFEGKKKQIQFWPKEKETLWVAGLYDEWSAQDGLDHIDSFAVITTEPPDEILSMGHDRCPITLCESKIDEWINTKNLNLSKKIELLRASEEMKYGHSWVAL